MNQNDELVHKAHMFGRRNQDMACLHLVASLQVSLQVLDLLSQPRALAL